jgi:hypothetical protein
MQSATLVDPLLLVEEPPAVKRRKQAAVETLAFAVYLLCTLLQALQAVGTKQHICTHTQHAISAHERAIQSICAFTEPEMLAWNHRQLQGASPGQGWQVLVRLVKDRVPPAK